MWRRFLDDLDKTVTLSDKLGFVYWFAVLTTISCGCATGIYVTLTNRNEMVKSCQTKYEQYADLIARHQIDVGEVPWKLTENGTIFSRNALKGLDEIDDLAWRINYFEPKIR